MNIDKLLSYNHANPILINFEWNHEIIGRLSVENNQLKFEGNGNLSAMIFFNECLKPIIDNYIRDKNVSMN
jgi:hypothetical protein